MRNAALTLGLIGGIIGMIVGFFAYGYVELTERVSELGGVDDPRTWQTVALLSPILAIAGAAMARARALWGGLLLLISAGAMYHAFGFTVATMFPIAMCGVAGILAIAAGKPDEEKAHF